MDMSFFPTNYHCISGGEAISEHRRFLKGLTSLALASVLANPRLAAVVSAGLQEVESKLRRWQDR